MKHAPLFFLSLVLLLPSMGARAESTITIDGNVADWSASDAQCMLSQTEPKGSDFVDVVNICVTDSYSTDGYFYLLMEFVWDTSSPTLNNNWLRNADVVLSVDTNSDGVMDREIDFLNDPQSEVWGIINLPYLEVRIDYDLMDPDGDRQFSFYVDTFWRNSVQDRVPFEDGGTVDYSVDPATGSPRSVRMLAQTAEADNDGVRISFVTASERANAGFHVYRKDADTSRWIRLTDELIAGLGDAPFGQKYVFEDGQGLPGDWYQIVDVEFSGKKRWNGAFQAKMPGSLVDRYIPQMVAKKDRPFNLRASLKRMFEVASSTWRNPRFTGAFQFQVDSMGLHRLSQQMLADAGLNGRVALQSNGGDIPVIADGRDVLFFDAPAPTRYADYDSITAKTAARGVHQMKKMRTTGRCQAPLQVLPHTQLFEEDVNYYVATPTDDPFNWAMVFGSGSAQLPFGLSGLQGGKGVLAVSLAGFATGATATHSAAFWINGVLLGERSWNGSGEQTVTIDIPEGLLQVDNQLDVAIPTGNSTDMLSIDRFSVTYPRQLAATSGQLLLDANENECLFVAISAPDVEILDVTTPASPLRIVGFATERQGVQFRVPNVKGSHVPRRILVTSRANALQPVPVRPVADVLPLTEAREAEYLVIAHPLFEAAGQRLADTHHASMQTLVVTTDQIYDHYTGGRPHPDGIRQFLVDAAAGTAGALRYVTLLGSATVDSNNVMGVGDEDFVPTYFYRTNLMGYEAASDVTFGAGLLGVTIGRLAVRSAAEANGVVDKLTAWYESGAEAVGRSVYIADHESGVERSFQGDVADQIAQSGSFAAGAEPFFLGQLSQPVEALRATINDGVDFVSFHGHAYVSGWSSPEVANLAFADSLQNDHLFFVLSFACFDGMFPSPWDESLAWQFVANPESGAFGALAGSSLADPAWVELFAQRVTSQLASGAPTVGDAVQAARHSLSSNLNQGALDTYYTYNLLGDPAAPNPWR